MRHAVEYQGPYDYNILRLRLGHRDARRYLKRDGRTTAAYRGPKDVDGVRFGMLELPAKQFRIVRIECAGQDVILNIPIRVKGTGPSGRLTALSEARTLLKRAISVNPTQKGALAKILRFVDS